jgi:hypothetical protein
MTASAFSSSGSMMASPHWPTPAARDFKGANSAEHLEISSGSLHLDQLPNFVEHLWSTPPKLPQAENLSGDLTAYTSRNIWPTPTAMSRPRSDETLERCRSVRKQKAGQNTVPLYLEDLVSRLSLRVPVKRPDGKPCSTERRSLNPLFVEWLMGWPPGWTLLVSSDFGCSATALSRFKRHMRFALSQLASHDEAPPAQLALFG